MIKRRLKMAVIFIRSQYVAGSKVWILEKWSFTPTMAVTGYERVSNIGKDENDVNEEAKIVKLHFATLNILAYLIFSTLIIWNVLCKQCPCKRSLEFKIQENSRGFYCQESRKKTHQEIT